MPSAEMIKQARQALQDGRLPEARRLLRQVVHEDPQNERAWLLLAQASADPKVAAAYVRRAEAVRTANEAAAAADGAAAWRRPLAGLGLAVLLGVLLLVLFFDRGAWGQASAGWLETEAGAALAEQPAGMPAAPVTSLALVPFAAGDALPTLVPVTAVPTLAPTPTPAADATPDAPPAAPIRVVENAALPAAIERGISAEALVSSPTSTAPAAIGTGEVETPQPAVVSDAEQSIKDAALPAGPQQTLPDEAFDSLAAAASARGERWIDVNLSTQTLVAYEGETAVFSTLISSGLYNYPTVTGEFRTWLKYESQDMNGYLLGYDYYLPAVPYVMYFFEDYAIHGAYWHNSFGTPMSHGCVNVSPTDAGWLFDWAPLGTLVSVHH